MRTVLQSNWIINSKDVHQFRGLPNCLGARLIAPTKLPLSIDCVNEERPKISCVFPKTIFGTKLKG